MYLYVDILLMIMIISVFFQNISLSISQLASAMNKMAENDERRLTNEENMVSVMKLLVEKM